MANVIYRGPVDRQPRTINLPVTGTTLPGTLVKKVGDTLPQAVAADMEAELYLVTNPDFLGVDVDTAYAADATAVAYVLEPKQEYQARLAGDTYADGDLLTVGALGRLAKATAGDLVLARFSGTAGAVTAGDLADVTVANSFVMSA